MDKRSLVGKLVAATLALTTFTVASQTEVSAASSELLLAHVTSTSVGVPGDRKAVAVRTFAVTPYQSPSDEVIAAYMLTFDKT
jgi:hypothetical protein